MSSDFLDDWDENFLQQVLQQVTQVEHAASSQIPTSNTTFSKLNNVSKTFRTEHDQEIILPTNAVTFRTRKEQVLGSRNDSSGYSDRNLVFSNGDEGFSPPRYLSQNPIRTSNSVDEVEVIDQRAFRSGTSNSLKEKELERLKRELSHLTKQLAHVENECAELKKETVQKDGQLKHALTEIEAKDVEISILKTEKFEASKIDHACIPLEPVLDVYKDSTCHGCPSSENKAGWDCLQSGKHANGTSENAATYNGHINQEQEFSVNHVQHNLTKTVGVQAELNEEPCSTSTQDDVSSDLLAIWGSPISRRSTRNFVSELFFTCSDDFYVLFSCIGSLSPNNMKFLSDESTSDMKFDVRVRSVQTVDGMKVSQLYVVLVEVSKGIGEIDNIIEVLGDLCLVDNAVIVEKALRILRNTLSLAFNYKMTPCTRGLTVLSQSDIIHSEERNINQHIRKTMDFSQYQLDGKSDDTHSCLQDLFKNEMMHCTMFITMDRRISLIEKMLKIAGINTSENIIAEAISVIKVIVMGSDPFVEREKFGIVLLTEKFLKFLLKEVGVDVQRKALEIMFLLLNCPKLAVMFYNQNKNSCIDISGVEVQNSLFLKGLSDCILCNGRNIMELKLQRKAIVVIAFIASSGQSGFDILLNLVTPQGDTLLDLVLKILGKDIDAQTEGIDELQATNDRIIVMREALILLNRLASNACYSKTVLGVLTRNAASTRLIVDVATKLSRRSRRCMKLDSSYQMPTLEAETIDLANSFKARVMSFLGESLS